MVLQAVFFDLHGTLAFLKNPLNSEEISEFFLESGYEIFPQSWDAASHFVGMVDYPKNGYFNRLSFLKQTLNRLEMEVGDDTLAKLASLYDNRNKYCLFSDAISAVKKAKELELKTAIVTTIPRFVFASAIEPIKDYFDVIMTGYEAGCEKSNPVMYKKTLESVKVRPDQAVMIGDELLVDVKIPKKLGMKAILLDRSRDQTKPCAADETTATLTEALAIVEKWHTS